MKNIILSAAVLLLFLTGCSNNDDNPTAPATTPSYNFDNQSYAIIPMQGISEVRQTGVFTFNGTAYTRSSITIVGTIGFAQTSTISFDLFYREGMSITGTYNIYDTNDSTLGFEDFVSPLDRGCMGWTSMGSVFFSSGADGVNANNPEGTVTVTANSANNYTIRYTGNFRIYDDNFDVARTVPCAMDITGTVVLQN